MAEYQVTSRTAGSRQKVFANHAHNHSKSEVKLAQIFRLALPLALFHLSLVLPYRNTRQREHHHPGMENVEYFLLAPNILVITPIT